MTTLLEQLNALIPDDDPDCFSNDIRCALISLCNDNTLYLAEFAHLDLTSRHRLLDARDAITTCRDDEFRRHELTETLLNFSLCPLHAIDFAICFDDNDAECAQIRTIYPNSHDT